MDTKVNGKNRSNVISKETLVLRATCLARSAYRADLVDEVPTQETFNEMSAYELKTLCTLYHELLYSPPRN